MLARMGRSYRPAQFDDFLASGVLKNCPSLFLDMSSASEPSAYEHLLERRELWSHLLFASNMPYGSLTGVDRRLDEARVQERRALTYNTYHYIEALKDACARLGIRGREEAELESAVFERSALEGVQREG